MGVQKEKERGGLSKNGLFIGVLMDA